VCERQSVVLVVGPITQSYRFSDRSKTVTSRFDVLLCVYTGWSGKVEPLPLYAYTVELEILYYRVCALEAGWLGVSKLCAVKRSGPGFCGPLCST